MKKAQFWSMDIMIAFLVLIAIMGSIIMVVNMNSEKDINYLITENEMIGEYFSKDKTNYSFYPNKKIDNENVIRINKTPYRAVKEKIGVKSDYCIHFETMDGRVIPVNGVYLMGDNETNVSLGSQTYSCNNRNLTK